MNYKINLLLLPLLFFTIGLKAQVGVWAGVTEASVQFESFDQFRISYNQVNASRMKKEMPNFGLSPGFSTGIEGHAKWFYGELSLNFLSGKTTAEYTNEGKREFKLNQNIYAGGFGIGRDARRFYAYAIGGLSAGGLLINSSFIYNDGTRSFGLEKSLNGESHGLCLGAYYGITAGITITKNIKLMLRAARFGSSKADSKFALTDLFGSKTQKVIHPDGLPTDWGSYLASGYSYTGGWVGTDINGWRLFICMHYQLGKKEE